MRRRKNGLRLAVRQTTSKAELHMPWGDCLIADLLLTGIALLLTDNLPSVSFPWWGLMIGTSLFGMILLLLYTTKAGKWILPIGLVVVLGGCFLFREQVIIGFGCLGNDVLDILTAHTGRIFLDFSVADQAHLLWFLIPLLLVCTLLVTRSVYNGRMSLLLPILLPAYAVALIGLIPCGIAYGLLGIGTVLLLLQHTGKDSMTSKPLSGFPAHLLIPVVCIGVCILAGTQMRDVLDSDIPQKLQDRLHQTRYDSDTNSMPEGELKNLSPWNKSDTPALEVTMEKPGKVYLRGEIYEVYTGTSWEPLAAEEKAEYEDLYYWLHRSGFYGQAQIGMASELTTQLTPLTITIQNLSACSAHGYYPYAVYGHDTLDPEQIGDTGLPAADTMTYLSGSVPQWYLIQNNLSSAQGREAIETYLTLEQAYGAYVEAFDLQLTQESWSVLNRQLELEDGSYTIAQIRDYIRSYLAENMLYDESIRTVNGNGDFLQYTLERSGCGYSVHYATAAVLMLRYFGVPARYVEGYFLSADEAARYMAGETITLTEEHAHAWAEYYVSGVGFVPFEVTPGYIDDEDLELGGQSTQEENTYQSNRQEFVEVQKPEDIEQREQDRATFSLSWQPLLLLLLPLLILLILIVLRRSWLNRALKAIDTADTREAIAMRYGYAARLLAHSTAAAPEGAEEAAKLNREALFSDHDMTDLQRQTMDGYAQRVLSVCKESWSWLQKLRYRLWDCLY